MKNKNYFFGFVIFLIVIFGIYTYLTPLPLSIYIKWREVGERLEDLKYVKIAGQNIKVDLALTSEIQEKGLSGRTELKENEGMLFVFPQPGQYAFWMKDMNFPLDIIWIGEDLKVVYIQKNALPESYPESFSPGKNAKYVLEVSTNFADKNNLKEGDSVEFSSS
ncbi:MAG: DUF192 domain-containing protein [Candidatus Paceibacterota bacterium]